MTKFVFCDDLGAPELLMLMDDTWARTNSDKIRTTPGISVPEDRELRLGDMLIIPNEADRFMFLLRWS